MLRHYGAGATGCARKLLSHSIHTRQYTDMIVYLHGPDVKMHAYWRRG